MDRVYTKQAVRQALDRERAAGRRIALVPTMGYLHEGHLSLVDHVRDQADFIVMSIYVNPLQFGPKEDFGDYPRDLDRDSDLARARGVDLVFAPSDEEMYPNGEPAVRPIPVGLVDRLCGLHRPGHFEGVVTVVTKLFNIMAPDVAVFGQKDYQQATIIRRMVADLDMPVEIAVAPVVREPDGLALSSRNTYLGDDDRASAPCLYRGLCRARDAFAAGTRAADELLAAARQPMDRAPGVRVQYLELVDPETLEPRTDATPGSVIAVAAHAGTTRLIDNVILR